MSTDDGTSEYDEVPGHLFHAEIGIVFGQGLIRSHDTDPVT